MLATNSVKRELTRCLDFVSVGLNSSAHVGFTFSVFIYFLLSNQVHTLSFFSSFFILNMFLQILHHRSGVVLDYNI